MSFQTVVRESYVSQVAPASRGGFLSLLTPKFNGNRGCLWTDQSGNQHSPYTVGQTLSTPLTAYRMVTLGGFPLDVDEQLQFQVVTPGGDSTSPAIPPSSIYALVIPGQCPAPSSSLAVTAELILDEGAVTNSNGIRSGDGPTMAAWITTPYTQPAVNANVAVHTVGGDFSGFSTGAIFCTCGGIYSFVSDDGGGVITIKNIGEGGAILSMIG